MLRIALLCVALLFSAPTERRSQGVNRVGGATAARIDSLFARMDRNDCPGCALGVSEKGRVVYTRGYGTANLEYSLPITPDTVFEAGSVSKQFTAAAVLLLSKEGKLSLDDDVRKYLPEVPDFGKKISVRHLLTHTSGLRDQWALLTLAGRAPGGTVHTLEEILFLVNRQKELNFDPGEEYLYSNTGYSLLAIVVQRVSGRSLAEFSRTEIFRPLGMAHSRWRDDYSEIVKGRATAYRIDANGAYHTDMPFTNVYGNGGLLTTVGDLLTWCEGFFRPGLLDQRLLDEMQTPARLNSGEAVDYGLGLSIVDYRGLRAYTHTGSTAGYRAFLARFPERRVSIAVLCNATSNDAGALAQRVADTVLEGYLRDPEKVTPVELSQEELGSKAGIYLDTRTDEVLRVLLREGKLVLAGTEQPSVLVPLAPDRFKSQDGQSELVFQPGGREKPVSVKLVDRHSRVTLYTAVTPAAPSQHDLEGYQGLYYSDELEVSYVLGLLAGKFVMWHRPEAPVQLAPAFTDAFFDARGRVVHFTRGSSGKVDGYRLFAGRVRHLRFVKRG